MKSFCFAAKSFEKSAAAMAGVKPLTSPPITFRSFDPQLLEGYDLLFFKLHGLARQPYWYGDGFISACSADQLRTAELSGALVFAANCFGGAESPMVKALLEAGAAAVITGEGLNYAGTNRLDGADVIGLAWRWLMKAGFTAEAALKLGKTAAKVRRPGLAKDIDSFRVTGNSAARLKGRGNHGSKTQS